MRNIRVRVAAPGGRTVGEGRVVELAQDRKVLVRFKRRIRAGIHQVVATGLARDGVVVRASRRVLVRR